MEKWNLYLILGLSFCIAGVLPLILGYNICKKQSLIFDTLTLILFAQFSQGLLSQFSLQYIFMYFPEIFMTSCMILLTFLQDVLQPLLISSLIYPMGGITCLSFGGIFVILAPINYRSLSIKQPESSKNQNFNPKH